MESKKLGPYFQLRGANGTQKEHMEIAQTYST